MGGRVYREIGSRGGFVAKKEEGKQSDKAERLAVFGWFAPQAYVSPEGQNIEETLLVSATKQHDMMYYIH